MDDHHLSTISRKTKQKNEQQTHNFFWQQQHVCMHPRTQEGIVGFPNMQSQVLIPKLFSIASHFISYPLPKVVLL
jgi:hypothetical protein